LCYCASKWKYHSAHASAITSRSVCDTGKETLTSILHPISIFRADAGFPENLDIRLRKQSDAMPFYEQTSKQLTGVGPNDVGHCSNLMLVS
jgi:hypothetical protein